MAHYKLSNTYKVKLGTDAYIKASHNILSEQMEFAIGDYVSRVTPDKYELFYTDDRISDIISLQTTLEIMVYYKKTKINLLSIETIHNFINNRITTVNVIYFCIQLNYNNEDIEHIFNNVIKLIKINWINLYYEIGKIAS